MVDYADFSYGQCYSDSPFEILGQDIENTKPL